MKKVSVLSLALVLSVLFTSAKEVQNGNAQFGKQEGTLSAFNEATTARLVLDYSNAEVVEFYGKKGVINKRKGKVDDYLRSRGADFQRDWPEICKNVQNNSEKVINKKFKMKIDNSSPKYEIRLVFDCIDFGSTAGSVIHNPFQNESGGACFSGTLKLIEIASGTTVGSLEVIFCQGAGTYTENKRMMYTIGDIFFGKFVGKFTK